MILFLQPAIPKYRTPFFDKLKEELKEDIIVLASKCDFLNVKSDDNLSYVKFCNGFYKLGPFYWHKNLNLPSLIKGDKIVICGNPWVINYMFILLYYKFFTKVKVIWWGQGWTAGSHGILSKIRRRLMNIADAIALYTDKEAKELITSKPILGLNNGLDSSKIEEEILSIGKIKKDNENIKLLFIGRLTTKSNILFILNAMTKSNNKIFLNIIGDGDLKYDVYRYISEYGLKERVKLHGAIFQESEIAKVAVNCDAFIYPGSVGLSIIHGFNYGLPAIVHSDENYHMPEFAAFKSGYNGLSFTKDNIDSLIETLNSLNFNTINELSENALHTVQDSYNVNDMVKRFSNLIEMIE